MRRAENLTGFLRAFAALCGGRGEDARYGRLSCGEKSEYFGAARSQFRLTRRRVFIIINSG